jgi:peptidyl-dipeptidase A
MKRATLSAFLASSFFFLALALAGCGGAGKAPAKAPETAPPTAAEVKAFLEDYERRFRDVRVAAERAAWDMVTDMSSETESASARANEALMAYVAEAAGEAARLAGAKMSGDMARQLALIRRGEALSAPDDPEKRSELARLAAELASTYSKGKHCKDGACRNLQELSEVLATSREPGELLEAWTGWRTVSVPMRPLYARFAELANEGARGLGYADLGAQWRSGYDMDADALREEVERLWNQVRPLYEQLHCHVRARLADVYGEDVVPAGKPIPAHLLGNMWAQSWENVFPAVAPHPESPGLDVGPALKARGATPEQMVRMGEAFFTSMGFDPLPQTFFERSMLSRPEGKEVSCHASAWDVGFDDDLRISMCIQPTMEDLITVHHELGHCYYYHAYYKLPMVYQTGAHDGFHEAIGDSLALSVTPDYLRTLGLLDKVSDDEHGRLNRQMHDGLSKIAFLPFAMVVDSWRWDVFGGAAPKERYNAAWWELRRRYQGIEAPVARGEEHFDPGAKYHVASHVPYLRYFLAHILQFQLHRALCEAAGHEGPLDRCSFHGSKEAGKKLRAMLALGASRPWPEALEAMTGERRMDAGALLEYFAPLREWLQKENAGRTCGW